MWALGGGRVPNYRHSTDDPAQKNNREVVSGRFQELHENTAEAEDDENLYLPLFMSVYLVKEYVLVEKVSKPTVACLRVDGCYTQSVLVG